MKKEWKSLKVIMVADSQATKLKGKSVIAATYTGGNSCPDSCPFKGQGCYGESGTMLFQSNRLNNGGGVPITELKQWVEDNIPLSRPIRHNVYGDMCNGNDLDEELIDYLCECFTGRPAWTYTHARKTERNFRIAKEAIEKGFVINFSCESIEEVEKVRAAGLPAVLACESIKEDFIYNGTKYMNCPSNTVGKKCSDCTICRTATRNVVVCFPAHGARKKKAIEAGKLLAL